MRILRHRHTLAFITLLAFAMQGVIAFADTHTHTNRHLGSPIAQAAAPGAGLLSARAMTYGLCRPSADQPCPPAQHDDRNCPICWSVSLAATAVLGAPPPVPAHEAPKWMPVPIRTAALLLGASRVQFQARAPPRLLA